MNERVAPPPVAQGLRLDSMSPLKYSVSQVDIKGEISRLTANQSAAAIMAQPSRRAIRNSE